MFLESASGRIRRTTPELMQRAKILRQEATEAECVFWEAVRGRRCGGLKFRRQHAVGQFILDFWCPEHRLLVELDGGIHDRADVAAHDREREAWIRRYGVRILRFRNEEVLTNLETVLQTILSSISPLTPLPPQRPEERGTLGEGAGG